MEKPKEDRIQNICKSWRAEADQNDDLRYMVISPKLTRDVSPSKKCVEFEEFKTKVNPNIHCLNANLLPRSKAIRPSDKRDAQEFEDEILARKLQEKYQRREERWLEREKWKKLSKERHDIELQLERLMMPNRVDRNGNEEDSDDYELVTRPGGPDPQIKSPNQSSKNPNRSGEIEVLDSRLAHVIQELEYIKLRKKQRAKNRSSMPVLSGRAENGVDRDQSGIREAPDPPPIRTTSKLRSVQTSHPNINTNSYHDQQQPTTSTNNLNKNARSSQLTIVANPLYFCTNSATSIISGPVSSSPQKETTKQSPVIECNPLYFGCTNQQRQSSQHPKEQPANTMKEAAPPRSHTSYLYYSSGQLRLPTQNDAVTSQPPPVGLPLCSTRDVQALESNIVSRNAALASHQEASARPKTRPNKLPNGISDSQVDDASAHVYSKPDKSSRKHEHTQTQHQGKPPSSERNSSSKHHLARQYPSQSDRKQHNHSNSTDTKTALSQENHLSSGAGNNPQPSESHSQVRSTPQTKDAAFKSSNQSNAPPVLTNHHKYPSSPSRSNSEGIFFHENPNFDQPTAQRFPRSSDSFENDINGESSLDPSSDPHRVPNYCFRDGSPLINPKYYGSPVTRLDEKICSGDAEFLIDRNAFPDHQFGKLSKHGARYNSDWMIGPSSRKHSTDSYYRDQPRQRNSLIEAVTNGISSLLESTGSDRKRNNPSKKKGFRPASYHHPDQESRDLSALLVNRDKPSSSGANNSVVLVPARPVSQNCNSSNMIPGEITVIGRDYVLPTDTDQSRDAVVRLRRNLNEQSSTDGRPWSGQFNGDLPVPMNRRRHSKELRPKSGIDNFDQGPSHPWTSHLNGNTGKKSSKAQQRPRSGMDYPMRDGNVRASNHNFSSNSKRKSAALLEEEVEKLYMEPAHCRPALMRKNFAHSTNCLDMGHQHTDCQQRSNRLDTASTPMGPTYNIAAALDPTFNPNADPTSRTDPTAQPPTMNHQNRSSRARAHSHIFPDHANGRSGMDMDEEDDGEDYRDAVLPLPDMRKYPRHPPPAPYKSGARFSAGPKKSKHSNCKVQ